MGKFNFIETKIKDLYIKEPYVFRDEMGYIMETYNERDFKSFNLDIDLKFVQFNEVKFKKGVLRGLRFQEKHAQNKLVRVVGGEVFDVAVDLRKDSPTYLQWEGVTLSSENKRQLYIPKGFAHGFLVLSDYAVVTCNYTQYYLPQFENGIAYNNPTLDINWPIDDIDEVLLLDRDRNWENIK
ncbi:dTDP-4-dehydrorhamnose 3,5-epimerase [Faecalimicrobium sp. JNUCC 81]